LATTGLVLLYLVIGGIGMLVIWPLVVTVFIQNSTIVSAPRVRVFVELFGFLKMISHRVNYLIPINISRHRNSVAQPITEKAKFLNLVKVDTSSAYNDNGGYYNASNHPNFNAFDLCWKILSSLGVLIFYIF
jgi:hypothetical protein